MKMTKLLLVLAFLLVMAAGAVVGMAVDRQIQKTAPTVEPPRTRPSGPRFPKLTPEQQAKFNTIWSEIDKQWRSGRETWRSLEKQRHDEIHALLSPDQAEKAAAIEARIRADQQKLDEDLKSATQKAEEATLAILTPEQQAQYKIFQQAHGGPRRGGGPGRSGGPGRGGPMRGPRDRGRPTTNPTTLPTNLTFAQ